MYINANDENKRHKEGDLYRSFSIHGKPFTLYYGFYDDRDREAFGGEPMPIYPNLRREPQYTDNGEPIVTKMQSACRYYDGKSEPDIDCGMCKHFETCEEFFGVCRCRANQKGHLISLVADRLGCTRTDLKKPENRELILNELNNGEIDTLNADEMRELAEYIAQPLKALLYGTEDDKALLLEWQSDENYFSKVVPYDTFEAYIGALKDDTFEVIICMADSNAGVEALKAAHEQCKGKPLMWFPKTVDRVEASFRYGCLFAGLQRKMNLADLTFGIKQCREKIMSST